jgi:hypothetical protein
MALCRSLARSLTRKEIWQTFPITIGRGFSTAHALGRRDDGFYVQTESIALSRVIPSVLRLVTEPIVRRVSRESRHCAPVDHTRCICF